MTIVIASVIVAPSVVTIASAFNTLTSPLVATLVAFEIIAKIGVTINMVTIINALAH